MNFPAAKIKEEREWEIKSERQERESVCVIGRLMSDEKGNQELARGFEGK